MRDLNPSRSLTATRLNTLIMAIAALILVTIAGLSYHEWNDYREAHAGAIRTRDVQAALNRLGAHLLDAETGQRGFLLTGEEHYLQPYKLAIQKIPADLAEIQKLLNAEPSQAGMLVRLNSLVEEKLDELGRTVAIREARGAAPAVEVVVSDQGKRIMDQIRDLLSGIQRQESSVLVSAQDAAAEAARRAFEITAGGALILLFITFTGTLKINTAIREREEALADAQKARDSLKTTIASIGDAVIATDAQGSVVFANRVAQSLMRAPEQELIGKHLDEVFRIVNEFTGEKVESPTVKVLREGATVGLANHTVLIARDGTKIPIDDSGAPIRGDSPAVQGMVLVFRDVSERRRAERNAAYLEAIVESSDAAIIGKSLEGIVQSWNGGAERLFGYRAEEIVGHPLSELIPPERLPEEPDILEEIRSGARIIHFETARRRKDGSIVEVAATVSPIRDKSGKTIGISHVMRDITEQKAQAEHLRQMQKLESLGILAGGIAHDFNNLLTGILGNAGLALDGLPPDSAARNAVECVIAASERAAHLTNQMLAYSGKGRFVLERLDLSAQIREMAPLIQAAIPRTVGLGLDLTEGLPAVEADPAQIQQLVMNIVINGAEAIAEGQPGTVTVATRLQDVDGQYPRRRTGSEAVEPGPGRYILLEVRDSGCGMDEETRARIFDPFFTTKFTGRGLGLAAVLGIVRGHGGWIEVSSTPGEGTVFYVLLPAVARAAEPSREKRQETADLRGSGVILVIDDEETVRRIAKLTLERYGYTVLLAENGECGLEVFRREAGRIRCVLLDLMMPVMSGEEALDRMRELEGGIPVILSSGFNEVETLRRFEGKGLAGFLQKPYKTTALLEKVKAAMGRTAGARS